jgi:hypothetical protein
LSRSELGALSIPELSKARFATLPEPPAYARAWYQQRGELHHYREMSFERLFVISLFDDSPTKEYALVLLEMDRRARCDGYVAVGEWAEAMCSKDVTVSELLDAMSANHSRMGNDQAAK